MPRMFIVAAAVSIVLAGIESTRAADVDLIVKASAIDFAATVVRLQTEIESRGAAIVATVDHAAAAENPVPT